MKWAFIDYENIGNLEKINLSEYQKIILFLGAKQPRLDFGDKKYDTPLNIIIVQLKAIQPNNLDFHLSYYLGRGDVSAGKDVSFEIISNDNGFAPLIAHIKANGRVCKHIKPAAVEGVNAKPSASASASANVQPKATLLQLLISTPKDKRPKKVVSLRNYISTHMRIKDNESAIQNHLNKLIDDKIISISGGNIEYKR